MNPWDDFWSRVETAVNSRDGESLKKLFVSSGGGVQTQGGPKGPPPGDPDPNPVS